MENKINVDFSKLEDVTISKPKKTVWLVCITAVILVVFAMFAAYMVQSNMKNGMEICKIVILLYLTFALSLVTLCYLLYEFESVQASRIHEELKANAALRRKLVEEAIMREIKIQEKEISDAQKRKQDCDK